MKLLEVLQRSTEFFKAREIESPRLNAEHLLAHVLGRKRIELYLDFERELSDAELEPLRDLVRRRGQGEPLQHLLGTVEFCGLTFACDKRALVPRPETEQLVELLVSNLETSKPGTRLKVVDVGTGSGVIALSLATKLPHAEIMAVDVSEEALALAGENAERLGLAGRVQLRKSNLLDDVDGEFDLIVANLPYVPLGERPNLSREVLHDPEVAVFAGQTGEELMRQLIVSAPPHLKAGGLLALEIGIGQAEALTAVLQAHKYHDISARQDFAGVTRFLLARHG